MSSAADPTSEQFGPYEVYERLGVGGMATVYRAKKRGPAGFERSVALKRMLTHLAEDPSFVESFVREAKVASLLQHPNVAQVYDFGRISGVYYIAMELVAGFDLRKLLRYANRANEAIPMPVILSILGELCDALDYAHTFVDESGQPLHIVHRDVSPSNLIVAHTGHLKVIDFGIAKASSRQLHTESGQVKGKLGYMSPEVALGMAVGPVADIFSAGVVAWELVTASPLFSARTDFETMRRIREEPIAPPSRLNPACPRKLDDLILAALQREPEHRLPTARLFRHALDQIAAETATQVSARAVAEWILKFAQPDDAWARAASGPVASPAALATSASGRVRSASGRQLPLPPEQVTARIGKARPATQLVRSPDDIQLATEIWGEDARTVGDSGGAGPDFHRHVSTPAPTRAPQLSSIPSLSPAARVAEERHPPTTAPRARASKKPYVILGALAVVALALGGVLFMKHRSSPAPRASLRFEVSPANAVVTLAGNEVGRTSPLDTKVAAGTYPLTVALDGYTPYTTTITARAGEQQTIRVALDKEEPQIEIAAAPPPVAKVADPEPAPVESETPVADDPPKQTKAAKQQKVQLDESPRAETPKPAPKNEPRPEPTSDPKPEPKSGPKREPKTDPKVTTKTDPKPEPKIAPKTDLKNEPKVTTKTDPKPEPKIDPKTDSNVSVKTAPSSDANVDPPASVEPAKPARTPVVQPDKVTKLSGEIPELRAKNASGVSVLAKLCIDEAGKVSSVKIVQSNPEIVSQLQTAFSQWRDKPFIRDGKPTPVCFPVSLRVVVKSS